MRTNRATILTVACISGILGLAAPSTAAANTGTIYVNPATGCSDSGAGTQAQPFCTLTAAANSASPGQTVQVSGQLTEAVQITKSGLPGQPIVIKGSYDWNYQPSVQLPPGSAQHALILSGVHDVVIEGMSVGDTTTDPIVVKDSSQVVLDRNTVYQANRATPSAGLRITGQSHDVTITRSYFATTSGIAIDPQVQNTTIAGNDLHNSSAGSIRATDAPNTVITNNTVAHGCGPGISLLGASTGATVENNIVVGTTNGACSGGAPDAQIAVSTGSVSHTKVDYNIVHAPSGHPDYDWSGSSYSTVADFHTNTTQGADDIDSDIAFDPNGPWWWLDRLTDADTAAVKSADPNAPAVPATDLLGYGPTDDPNVPTPANGTLLDRGAFQLQGLTYAQLLVATSTPTPQGAAPLTATFHARVANTWPTKLTYTYDFGDGTTQTSDQATVTHVYTTAGKYQATVTVTDGVGGKVTSQPSSPVTVAPAGSTIQPSFVITHQGGQLTFALDASGSTSPYRITDYTVDFGDGSGPVALSIYQPTLSHTYAVPGTYNVALTVIDESGKSATATQQVTAAYDPSGYVALPPTRIYDTRSSSQSAYRLSAGEIAAFPVGRALNGSTAVPAGATAVVVNLTATGGTDDSFLTAYPSGTKLPTASNVNFKPGQNVSNVVTVPVAADGTISLYNHVGTVDVVMDVLGYYKQATGSNYSPVAPSRLLDTRATNAPLSQGGVQSLQVAGTSTVPANATAVALNVTATQGTDDSFLTVYPTGQPRPAQASNVNFKAGADTGNQVIVPVGANGSIDIYNHIGSVHAIVDVFGYYSADSKGKFIPVVPQRLMDTRQQPNHALGADSAFSISGVPASASAAVLNVTAVDGTDSSFLTVYGANTPRPGTSNLNFGPGQTVPNEVITPVNNGSFNVYNHVGSTDVITDLFGYFTNN